MKTLRNGSEIKTKSKNTTETQRTQSIVKYQTLSSLCLCGEHI